MSDRTVSELLALGREIWGNQRLELTQITDRLMAVVGDISRASRDHDEGGELNTNEVAKEFGNLILSAIRWCDDLGIDLDTALVLGTVAQRKYAQRLEDSHG